MILFLCFYPSTTCSWNPFLNSLQLAKSLSSPCFIKKYCSILRPSICPSLVLSPPKPVDEIQPNLVCYSYDTHMNGACNSTFFAPPPGRGGQAFSAHQQKSREKVGIIGVKKSRDSRAFPNIKFITTTV